MCFAIKFPIVVVFVPTGGKFCYNKPSLYRLRGDLAGPEPGFPLLVTGHLHSSMAMIETTTNQAKYREFPGGGGTTDTESTFHRPSGVMASKEHDVIGDVCDDHHPPHHGREG